MINFRIFKNSTSSLSHNFVQIHRYFVFSLSLSSFCFLRVVNLFEDPEARTRPIRHLSWSPNNAIRLAAAYAYYEYERQGTTGVSPYSYVWDIGTRFISYLIRYYNKRWHWITFTHLCFRMLYIFMGYFYKVLEAKTNKKVVIEWICLNLENSVLQILSPLYKWNSICFNFYICFDLLNWLLWKISHELILCYIIVLQLFIYFSLLH